MKYRVGRKNFALTVYVPYDCANKCPFCTSKHIYEERGVYEPGVELTIYKVFDEYDFPIRDVVFTGGEPMADVGRLKNLIDLVPDEKDVYINTTLVRKDLFSFIELVNKEPKIKGVNVSRHGTCYTADQANLNDIAPDESLKHFEKPVRINVVLDKDRENDYNNLRFIQSVIDRWEEYKNVSIEFRADYREVKTDSELHTPYTTFPLTLFGMGLTFLRRGGCNVCDDLVFGTQKGMVVSYHRGLESTSLEIIGTDGACREINDLIVYPNGLLDYDWKNTDRAIMDEIKLQFAEPCGFSVCGGRGTRVYQDECGVYTLVPYDVGCTGG